MIYFTVHVVQYGILPHMEEGTGKSYEVGTRRLALEAVEQPNRMTYPLTLWNSDSSEKAPAAIP